MKVDWIIRFLLCVPLVYACSSSAVSEEISEETIKKDWAIVIHGGAGNFDSTDFTRQQIERYKTELQSALDLGKMVLSEGGDAVDVVEYVIKELEDCPLFNAGRGAVFTAKGANELDASIMDGRDLNCGSVAGITNIRNPITAARAVMDHSPHVFLSGPGATSFALETGLEWADSSFFKTERRWNRFLELRGEEMAFFEANPSIKKFGTVGCVVLDMNGNLSAGTSTGGMMMKRHGRIGDSPVVAAGTYADNSTCAVSCTGHGEYFIRAAVAHDLSARMGYGGQTLVEAAEEVIHVKLVDMGGEGGLIAIDANGEIHTAHNTSGMFRAFSDSEGEERVLLFK